MDDLVDLTFASPIPTSSSTSGHRPHKNGTSSFDYLSASIARPSIITPGPPPNAAPPKKTNPPYGSKSAGTSSSDAFSSLFGINDNLSQKTNNSASSMTIAERLKAAESEKYQKMSLVPPGVGSSKSSSSSPIMGSSFPATSSLQRSASPLAPSQHRVSQSQQTQPTISADPWDLDFLEATSRGPSRAVSPALPTSSHTISAHHTAPLASRKNSWDIDLDVDPSDPIRSSSNSTDGHASLLVPPTKPTPSRQSSGLSLLGDEFGPLEEDKPRTGSISLDTETDDILGVLGAPIVNIDPEQIRRDAAQVLEASSSGKRPVMKPPSQTMRSNGSSSPPPHITGQVVEMGFSIPQARQALNQTRDSETGQWNVAAAVETLLSSQDQSPFEGPSHGDQSGTSRIARSPPRSRTLPNPRRKDESRLATEIPSPLMNAKEIQDQAAELLAQASAYGSTALGKAASFWKQSKASLHKVIDDQTSAPPTPVRMTEGGMIKPRWMKDSEPIPGSENSPSDALSPMNPFSDHNDGTSIPGTHRSGPVSRQPSPQERRSPEMRQAYVSSARRKVVERNVRKPNPEPTISSTPDIREPKSDVFSTFGPDLLTNLSSGQVLETQKPSPPSALSQHPIININQNQVSSSLMHRNKGNVWFKQGQYSNAELAYTQALDTLQAAVSDHEAKNAYFGCLPILNNRAAARLKNGDGKGAREDVNRVIEILLCEDSEMKKSSEHLIRRMELCSTRIPTELNGAFDVNEQLGKALSKRAKIKEDCEKWEEAKVDWEYCRSLGGAVMRGAGGMKIVGEGLSRCTKASGGGGGGIGLRPTQLSRSNSTQPSSAGRIRPVGARARTQETAAVQKLREANQQAELESNQRLESKDMVDSKIENWKGGKETNLRALLASLDQVLWEKLNWKKIGMGELLTEGQVKSRYVRAISKVHPDKIPKDATVEEQMIAKSVFAALNEAWVAMQG